MAQFEILDKTQKIVYYYPQLIRCRIRLPRRSDPPGSYKLKCPSYLDGAVHQGPCFNRHRQRAPPRLVWGGAFSFVVLLSVITSPE